MSLKNLSRLAAWSLLGFIVFVTVCPIDLRPPTETTVNFDRALAFGATAFLLVLAYPQRWKEILALLPIFAFGSELMQFLSASRHPQLPDAAFKALGAFSGGALGCLALLALSGWRRKNASSA